MNACFAANLPTLKSFLISLILGTLVTFSGNQPASAQEASQSVEKRGGNSGLPIPRMVSLGSQEINMRSGPGTRYPIKWVYTRRGLPVQVEAEFDIWRKIRDRDGETGWVHGSMLSGRRTVELIGQTDEGISTLRDKPTDQSAAVLRTETGVIAELLDCKENWCRLRVEGKKGWVRRQNLWGLTPADG